MEITQNKPVIVIYGAGAIGATIGGWLSSHYDKIYLLARGENARVIKTKGLVIYENTLENKNVIKVNIIEDLNELEKIDVVIIAVKNYDLEEVAKDIYAKVGDKPLVIALQNGVENQKILPKYFSKIIYGVIILSAWRDEPGIYGYNIKGYVIIGTLTNSLQAEMKTIKYSFIRGFKFKISQNIQDAIHTKLIFNLSNSIITLINHTEIDKKSVSILGHIYYNTLVEGISIFEAAGFKEHRLPGLIPWNVLKKTVQGSDEKSGIMLINRLEASGPNSMTQDIIMRQKTQSELEHLNGYIVNLAKNWGISAPYNNTIYELCKSQFQKKPYEQLKADTVWNHIQQKLNR
ncbi:MAG: ketopantoate reductase family protein [Candidatus Lokiarchaeota archaeon]|nr:ketopantoate reductase family protein [Candidatus Lokiarchaeota archaeon]